MILPEQQRQLIFIFLLAVAICVPALFWLTFPARDSALYARLTLEFSEGNFDRAFNADYPPLLTSLGGIINYWVGEPFLANQIASISLFLFGIPGTYMLAKEMSNAKTAAIAAILYSVCPYTVELATSGGVDSGKLALLPWLVWATYKWCSAGGLRWGMTVGLVGGVLSYSRGEGALFAAWSLLLFTVIWIFNAGNKGHTISRTISSLFAAFSVLLLVTLPLIAYQFDQTGYIVTHPSQIRIYDTFDRLKRSLVADATASSICASDEPTMQTRTPEDQTGGKNESISWSHNMEKAIKGFYIPFFLLALVGIWHRKLSGQRFSRKEIFPLTFMALNFAIFFPSSVTASRYFQTTIPLYLYLSATGVLALSSMSTKHPTLTPNRIKFIGYSAILVFALLAQKECDFLKNEAKLKEDKTLMQIGRWISDHREIFPFYGTLPNSRAYQNGRIPVILSVDFRIAYYAKADCVILPRDIRLMPQSIAKFSRRKNVSLILYDKRFEELCPGFGDYWPADPVYRPVDLLDDFPRHNQEIRLLALEQLE